MPQCEVRTKRSILHTDETVVKLSQLLHNSALTLLFSMCGFLDISKRAEDFLRRSPNGGFPQTRWDADDEEGRVSPIQRIGDLAFA